MATVATQPSSSTVSSRAPAAAGDAEARLAAIWQRVLNLPAVTAGDDFFALGGTSLAAAEIFAAIQSEWNLRLPLATLYRKPTLRALAAAIAQASVAAPAAARPPGVIAMPVALPGRDPVGAEGQRPRNDAGPVVVLNAATGGTPLIIVPGVGGDVIGLGHLARALPAGTPLWALRSPGLLPGEAPIADIPSLATHFATALRELRPAGPVRLAGLCFGGIVALELARQLSRAGVRVTSLVLVDPPRPRRPQPDMDPGAAPPARSAFVRRRLALYRATLGALPLTAWPGYIARRLVNAGAALRRGEVLAGDPAEAARRAVDAANRQALRRYAVPAPPLPVTLFFTADRTGPGVADERAGWIARFDAAGRVVTVPGRDTGDALSPANAPGLAAALGAVALP